MFKIKTILNCSFVPKNSFKEKVYHLGTVAFLRGFGGGRQSASGPTYSTYGWPGRTSTKNNDVVVFKYITFANFILEMKYTPTWNRNPLDVLLENNKISRIKWFCTCQYSGCLELKIPTKTLIIINWNAWSVFRRHSYFNFPGRESPFYLWGWGRERFHTLILLVVSTVPTQNKILQSQPKNGNSCCVKTIPSI